MNKSNDSMASRIKAARLKTGLSQADVARRLNLTRQAYNIYETGKTYPRTEKIEQLAEIFGVPISYFLEREPDGSGNVTSNDQMLISIYNALSESNAEKLIDYIKVLYKAERDGVQL